MYKQIGITTPGTNFYGVIDDVTYDKEFKRCNWQVVIYENKEARENNSSRVDAFSFNFEGDLFDSTIGNNGCTITQAYQTSELSETMADWEDDQ